MKQTAVEWLYKNLLENPISNQDLEYNEAVFHNAKKIEKQQQGYSEEEVEDLIQFLSMNEDFKNYSSISIYTTKYFLEQFKKK